MDNGCWRRLLACPESPVRSFRWANTSINPCIGYFAKSWSPHLANSESPGRQARPEQNRIRRRKNSDPLRQLAPPNDQNVHISRGIRPLVPIPIGWRRGARGEKKLDSCVLLALRQFPRLAGRHGRLAVARRGCIPRMSCVCKTRRHASNNVVTLAHFEFNHVVPRIFRPTAGPGLMKKPGKEE
jgi:hypothetical protein